MSSVMAEQKHSLDIRSIMKPLPLTASAAILELIEGFGPSATGTLLFGGKGAVHVELGRICWATVPHMRRRLTDRLCERSQQLPFGDALAAELAWCRNTDTPMGEHLVKSAAVSALQLRACLREHTADALTLIAASGHPPSAWADQQKSRYDTRFAFSTAEVQAAIVELGAPVEARAIRRELRSYMDFGATGAVLLREDDDARAIPIAIVNGRRLGLSNLSRQFSWAAPTVERPPSIEPGTPIASGIQPDGSLKLAWSSAGLIFLVSGLGRRSFDRTLARLVR